MVGPSGTGLVGIPPLLGNEQIADLQPLIGLALSLILLNIGAQFRAENLRRWKGRILRFSLAESGFTFLLVAGTTALVNLVFLRQALSVITSYSIHYTKLYDSRLTARTPSRTRNHQD